MKNILFLVLIALFCTINYSQNQTQSCIESTVNGIVIDIMKSNSRKFEGQDMQCLNRSEKEIKEHHIATTGGGFIITCNSEGPTEFFFEGETISPILDFFVSRWYTYPKNQRAFRIGGGIFQNNTGRYGCKMANNATLSNSVYVYPSENSPPYILQSGTTIDIYLGENYILLPCVCADAFVEVNLYKLADKERLHLTSSSQIAYSYDRTKGFYLNISDSVDQSKVLGTYLCATKYENDFRKYNIHPAKVAVTTEEKYSPNISSSWESINNWRRNVTSGTRRRELQLSLRTRETSIECTFPSKSPTLTIISCTNRIQCDFRRTCLLEIEKCPSVSRLAGRRCWDPNCSNLVYPPDAGIILCSADSMAIIRQYYTGFDNTRYSVDDAVPSSVLLQIHPVSGPLYTKTNSTFYCQGVGFMLSQMLTWGFEYRNGSTSVPNEKADFNDTKELGQLELVSRTSSIFISSFDIVKLICLAPLLNSTVEWINVTMGIAVKESKEPWITNRNTQMTFYTGETNKNLVCSANGTPTPKLHWERNGTLLAIPSADLYETVGEAVIRFTSINGSHAGKFICVATNFLGNARKAFTLIVEDPPTTDVRIYLGLGFGSLTIIVSLFVGLAVLYHSLRKSKKLIRQLSSEEIDEFLLGTKTYRVKSIDHSVGSQLDKAKATDFLALPYNIEYEIAAEALELGRVLGSGAYGIVLLGTLTKNGVKTTVAVKTVSPDADVFYFKALLSELKIMSHMGTCPNIITLLGAATREIKYRKVYIVLEFCAKGNLHDYLRTNRNFFIKNAKPHPIGYVLNAPLQIENEQKMVPANGYVLDTRSVPACTSPANVMSSLNLITWALETALGMEYLASKKIVHGDLATRNILLTLDCIAKITDFGMSKQLYENNLYRMKNEIPVPWRWMSLEGLKDMIFSSEGDMWSYGVTLWEIFSLGEVPYPGLEWSHTFLMDLEKGFRLSCPKYASDEIFELMEMAWDSEPTYRPTFSTMVEFFQQLCP